MCGQRNSSLGFLLTAIDQSGAQDWYLANVPWLNGGSPDGARSLLSTIAGSMISVAGVTFSITLATLSLASAQLGPRLLTNFMRDRGNQVVLGTFVAIFIYCLIVLRAIRSTDESLFVPHLSVTVAMFLSVISVAILIYFFRSYAGSANDFRRYTGFFRSRFNKKAPKGANFGRSVPELHWKPQGCFLFPRAAHSHRLAAGMCP